MFEYVQYRETGTQVGELSQQLTEGAAPQPDQCLFAYLFPEWMTHKHLNV